MNNLAYQGPHQVRCGTIGKVQRHEWYATHNGSFDGELFGPFTFRLAVDGVDYFDPREDHEVVIYRLVEVRRYQRVTSGDADDPGGFELVGEK